MTLDNHSPPGTGTSTKPKKWTNVRRKFATIIASRHSPAPPAPDAQTAISQAESFCRPYVVQSPPSSSSSSSTTTTTTTTTTTPPPTTTADSPASPPQPPRPPPREHTAERDHVSKPLPDSPTYTDRPPPRKPLPKDLPPPEDPDSDLEIEFDALTVTNSARNIEITAAGYAPMKEAKKKKKKKRNRDKAVRFTEEPVVIPEAGERCLIRVVDPEEEEEEEEEEEGAQVRV